MNGCANCFTQDGPVRLTNVEPSLGNCDFCGTSATDVWDVRAWADHFARVLDIYEVTEGPEPAKPLHERLQEDWRIFRFDGELVFTFLDAVFEGRHALLSSRDAVRPRYEDQGAGADHATRWDEFCYELIHVNRYFPSVDFDIEFLRALIRDNLRRLSPEMRLHRGRVSTSPTPYPPEQMGVAPARKVGPGRGNPVGIPHLYLADDIETCLKESRAPMHGFVSVASFSVTAEVAVLDLADLQPEDPFVLPDADEGNALVRSLVSSQFLRELGRELSIPTRPGENQIEYVPTQYLCELVKAEGIRGIRYESAMHPSGWNVVLFHEADVSIVPPVRVYEVEDASFVFTEVTDGN